MRLCGQIHITVRGDIVTRDPTLLEKLKRGLGGKVNLATDRMENQLEATAVVDGVRRALGKLGVGNALSLVIDDTVVFQDADGKPDDLPDLVLTLSEHASVFGRGFRELRFAAEHEEGGLHLVIETRARTQHHRDEPAAVVSVGGRMRALEAQKGESAEAYRARVEPLLKDATSFETARHAFESFVHRLEGGLRAAMPEATIEEKKTEARLVKAPERAPAAPEVVPTTPMHPAYDPFLVYYPSPVGALLDVMMFSSFMHMMSPPAMMVMSPFGATLGTFDDIQANPDLVSDDNLADRASGAAIDDGPAGGDDAVASGDAGNADDSGGWFDGDGGGGFDGGSFD